MRKLLESCIVLFLFVILATPAFGQGIPSKYHSFDEMTKAIKDLASTYSDIVRTESIGKTMKGRDIWLMTIHKGDPDLVHAMLVVGGTEATQIAGSEMALRFVEHLAKAYGKVDSVTKLLQTMTVYVVPRVSPDATEAYFEKPVWERATNYRPTDDDHDGLVDEDNVEDLNNDGVITIMRIKDPRGEWMVHPEDSRLMKKADAAKGERGSYLVYAEGIDNDKDEQWNEDAAGGVDFNHNFPFNYQFFSANAGLHQVSEKETRAIADLIFSKQNIGVVFSFSSNDNLTTPWRSEPRRAASTTETPSAPPTGGRGGGGGGSSFMRSSTMDEVARGPVTSVLEEDQPYYENMSKQFLDITKLSGAPETKKGVGAFSEWVYYHTGRWSFSVRPWWAMDRAPRRDTAAGDAARRMRPSMGGRTPQSTPEQQPDEYTDQLKALKWYDAGGYKDIAVPWTKTKHPDFPDREIEIGGPKPHVLTNPPADSLNTFAQPYMKFLTYLAAQLPTISLGNIKVDKVNDNVFRLTLDVVNSGYFPTNSSLGARVRWPRNVYLTLSLAKDQSLASGKAKQPLSPIKGNGNYQTMSWLIVGRAGSAVSVTAESPIAGKATETITLREGGRQ